MAVLLVVLFHLWPDRVSGGYVGVDVFFVISGYLITSHLVRELQQDSRLRFGRFYARRVRRLLPAALLVLLTALLGVLLLVPRAEWATMLRDIYAAAMYSVNWVLAASAVDYFAAEQAASPVQHYWSLSVEEQFYIVWPILLLAAWRVGRKRVLLLALSVVCIASLGYSIAGAYQFQTFAYFATPAHAWEFALGGFLALTLKTGGLKDGPWLTAASWAGWGAIVGSALVFDASTRFPGWIAIIPVAGTILVIAAGMPRGPWAPSALVSWRPVQFLGDISYSLYLWHWLPIVLLPYVLEQTVHRQFLTGSEKVVVLVVCVALAWATKVVVEDPFRRAKVFRLPVRTFGAAAVATAVVVVAAVVPAVIVERQKEDEAARLDAALEAALSASGDPCFGARASQSACPDSHVVADPTSVKFVADDTEYAWINRRATQDDFFDSTCSTVSSGNEVCRFGDAESELALAVVGDSHAGHLLPAILTVANAHDWSVDVWRITECTPAVQRYPADKPDAREECQDWKDDIFDDVASSEVDIVVTSSFTARYTRWMTASVERVAPLEDGFLEGWEAWRDAGMKVLAVSDSPAWPANIPRCVAQSSTSAGDPCSESRGDVVYTDPLLGAVDKANDENYRALDITELICDDARCHAVVGGLIVARDTTHLTATFSATLAPFFEAALGNIAPS